MIRFAHMVVLAAFLAVGFGAPMSFAGDQTPAEHKEKKDVNGSKADDGGKKNEKKGVDGK